MNLETATALARCRVGQPDVRGRLTELTESGAFPAHVEAVFRALLADALLEPLGLAGFTCPNDIETPRTVPVLVLRFMPFAQAIGVAPGAPLEEAPDTQFVLLPPSGGVETVQLGLPEGQKVADHMLHAKLMIGPYLLARTAVSQRIYDALGGAHDPFDWRGAMQPANQISWRDAGLWCRELGLRLPTEAEWELGCRGGTHSPFCFGSTIGTHQVNYDGRYPWRKTDPEGECRNGTVEVGSLPHNGYGLHEVHGNLYEWCEDKYRGHKSIRVRRGGCWGGGGGNFGRARNCHASFRSRNETRFRDERTGLRPARTVQIQAWGDGDETRY